MVDLETAKAELDKLEGTTSLPRDLVLTSIAISLKRIANSLAMMNQNWHADTRVTLTGASEVKIKT